MMIPNSLSEPLLDEPVAVAVPADGGETIDDGTTPASCVDDESDDGAAAAEASAAAARRECTSLIRNHLAAHLSQNPGSTFVSWIATLHPENATVSIDQRFYVPGNPWLTVYEEAKRDLHCDDEGEVPPPSSSPRASDYNDNEGADPRRTDDVPGRRAMSDGGSLTSTTNDNAIPRGKSYGGCVDLIVGLMLAAAGTAAALAIELCAAHVYLCEVLCHRIVSACSPATVLTALPLGSFWILLQIFRFLDAILLLVSITVVELIAMMSALICAPLALSCLVGMAAHQRTRKLAHLTRWACRHCFDGWTPARVTFGCVGSEVRRSPHGDEIAENEGQ